MGRADIQGEGKTKHSWKSKKLDNTLVGQQIKKYRILKNLRQKDLAELVFTTTNTISRIEIGNVGCSLDMLLVISDVLEVSPDALLFGNFNPLYSRFYPYFWQMKEAILLHVEESIQGSFREMEQKEELFSVEKDFHDWIAQIEKSKFGKVAERADADHFAKKEVSLANNIQEEELSVPGKTGEDGTVEALKNSTEEAEEKRNRLEPEKTIDWRAAIGGSKKKSNWLFEEWTKDTRKKREEEERARRNSALEEIRKEKEKIRQLEEETAEAKAKLAEKERREESFSYAADSFLFPKRELAESGKNEVEKGRKRKKQKAEKVQQRVRLKKTEE